MSNNYSDFQFDVQGKSIKGFCMRIHDDFHETYAVVLDGYHSFCVWLDGSSNWRSSKHIAVEPGVLERVIGLLATSKEPAV
jgi:hypothetical protein